MDHNAELREFLRTRRARLRPEDAGVPVTGTPRRVPGLRREELAQLAGVSTDYYTRLEQGRQLNVSETVLDAVAGALRLDDTERGYLFELCRQGRRTRARLRPGRPQRVRPGLYSLLRTLDDAGSPAFVIGHRMDILASNRLVRALITDFDALPHRDRNLVRFMFLDETARELYGDWEAYAADSVAALRLSAGRHPDDRQLNELVGELTIKSAEFRTWWADHNVREKTHGSKIYRHPLVGETTLSYENVIFPGDRDQTMCIYHAEPGSPAAEALRLLASWTAATPITPSPPSTPSTPSTPALGDIRE
jgi:transcriptional regulator with XRE-family HTH domain